MIAYLILLPLTGAVICYLTPPRWSRMAALAATLTMTGVAFRLAASVWSYGSTAIQTGGWSPPLGIELRGDGLSAALLALTASVGLLVAIGGWGYFGDPERTAGRWGHSFWPLLLALLTALNVLFLARDVFTLYVALELATFAAVGLVVLADEPVARAAAMRYLIAAFVGALLYLLGVALLYGEFGALDISVLRERLMPGPVSWVALGLIASGLSLKAALFPLHFWLPKAHASAPPPVSSLLSTLVVTGAFYLLLRLWFEVFARVTTVASAQLFGVLGAAAIVWGSLQAIRQQRLKLMIAYSTVAQVGYLFLIIPLATSAGAPGSEPPGWSIQAWNGGIYHALSHAFAKTGMFLGAGAIVRSLGHDRIVGISGISTHLPISTYAFGLSGMTLIGLPPSGGFVAKWLLLSSSIDSGQWWWGAVIVLGGILTAGYVFIVLGQELSEARSDQEGDFAPVPRALEYAAMAAAVAGLALGLRAVEPLQLLQWGNPLLLPFPVPPL